MAIKYFKSKPNPHSSSTEFYAQGERGEWYDEAYHPVAEVELQHGGYSYPNKYGDTPENIMAERGDQLNLFSIEPSTITSAFADHRMRSATPVVLGMAINEAKKLGFGLTYSADLSKHSSKLARRGLDLGVVVPNIYNPEAMQENSIANRGLHSYEHTQSPRWFKDYDEVQPEEVKAGRETIRGIVRQGMSTRKSHLSEQFQTNNEQLKLPGFD